MNLRRLVCTLLLLLKYTIDSAQSCDSSSGCHYAQNDLSPIGIMLGHEHNKGTWKLSYRYMNMAMNGNISGTQPVAQNYMLNNYGILSQNMSMSMPMLMAMYGVTDKLSLMAMFNYNALSMNMSMGNQNFSVPMKENVFGIGDTKLYAIYKLFKKGPHILFVNAGINIPTGNIYVKGKNDDDMYPNQRLPYMMQLGSGTVDFMPGITYLMKQNNFSGSIQVTSVIRPFNNSLGYNLGNELSLNAWVAYKWLKWLSTSVRVDNNYTGTIMGKDAQLLQTIQPGASPVNYGGQTVNGYAGVNFYVNKRFSGRNKLSVEYGVPMYQYVNGIQIALKSTWYAGWTIMF